MEPIVRPWTPPEKGSAWFLMQPADRLYALREASALVIAVYVANLVVGLGCAALGPAPAQAWAAAQASPVGRIAALVCFAMAMVHTATWFALTPKALPRVIAGRPTPARAVVGALWVAFARVMAAAWGWA